MPKRRTLAPGVYEDDFGISVVYQSAGSPIETRFPRGSDVAQLTRWRDRQIQQALSFSPRVPRNALARDVVRYLKRLKGLPCYKSEKSFLKAWLRELGPTTRRAVNAERCDLIIAKWRDAGYAPRTIRHRVRAFRSVYKRLDGKSAPTPLDNVTLPKKPRARPISVADTVIAAVALQLRKHEIVGTMRDSKSRARFLVLATTGRRPAELMRALPEDLDLERRLWFTRGAKGGFNTIIYLNEEMVAAWKLFMKAHAWGEYDCRSFSKTLKRAGWPAQIRPYNLRHSTALVIRARGGDLEDVQDQLGHASIETARAYYLSAIPARQRATSARLAGRFAGEAFAPVTRSEKKRNVS